MIRIVKMTFRADCIEAFKATFHKSKPTILTFSGCSEVRLLQDDQNPCIMTTYSVWESQEHLDAYRSSEFFKSTWKHTKTLFSDKPDAISYSRIDHD